MPLLLMLLGKQFKWRLNRIMKYWHLRKMLMPRKPTLWTAIVLLLALFTSPIWNIEVENYWLQTVRPHLKANVWDWVLTVADTLTGFWGGALLTLAVLVCFDLLFAWRRKRSDKQVEDKPSEADLLKQQRLMKKEERLHAEQEKERVAKENPPTSEYDLPKKLTAIDNLLEIVGSEKEYEQLYRRGKGLARNWDGLMERTGPKALAHDIEVFGEACNILFQKINKIRKANEHYQDIWKILEPIHPQNMSGYSNRFLTAVRNLGEPPPEAYKFFMKPHEEDFKEGLDQFGSWRFKCEKALLKRRMELSG